MFKHKKTGEEQKHSPRGKRGIGLKIWHTFVMIVGYATLAYLAGRGVILLLVALNGASP